MAWQCKSCVANLYQCFHSLATRILLVSSAVLPSMCFSFWHPRTSSPRRVLCLPSLLTLQHICSVCVSPGDFVHQLLVSHSVTETEVVGQCLSGWLGSITHWPKSVAWCMHTMLESATKTSVLVSIYTAGPPLLPLFVSGDWHIVLQCHQPIAKYD